MARQSAEKAEDALARAKNAAAEARQILADTRSETLAGRYGNADRQTNARDAEAVALGGRSRDAVRTGALEGDQADVVRYKAVQDAEREYVRATQQAALEIQRAEQAETDAVVSLAKQRADAYRDMVRMRAITSEEERDLLRQSQRDFAQYAEAVELIEKRVVTAESRTVGEHAREQHNAQREAGGSLINAGYVLPGGLGNTLTNLGYAAQGGGPELAILGGLTAAIGAGGALAEAANVAAKDQEAIEKLGVAVKNQGGNWEDSSRSVDAYAELQERTTTFSRSETIPALLELANGGVELDKAFKIVRVAEDAAAATGKPLVDITHELLNAYNGNARGLISLGVATKDQIRDGMQFSDVLGLIEKNMGGQATSTDSLSKKQTQLKNDTDELVRSIGVGLLPALTEGTADADKFVRSIDREKLTQGTTAGVHGFEDLAGAIGKAVAALAPLYSIYEKIAAVDVRANVGILGAATNIAKFITDRSVANSGLTTANLGVAGGAASGGGAGLTSQPLGISNDVNLAIDAAAKKYGIDVAILRAVGEQETGLGRSSAFDPLTGRSRTGGNAGRGIFQLDPASGANAADLERASTDVYFAADRAAKMLRDAGVNQNPLNALAAYNAGGPNAKGLAYAQQVIGRLGPSDMANAALNPASTDVQGRGTIGPSKSSTELKALYETYYREEKAGITDARQTYEEALRAIGDDTTKSLTERVEADKQYQALVRQDAAATTREQREQAKVAREIMAEREKQLRLEESAADVTRKNAGSTQAAYAAEIASLEKLRTARAGDSDANASRDVEALDAKIAALTLASTAAWQKALTDAGRYYKNSSESLDEYLAKLKTLERGTSTEQKAALAAAAEKAITDAATTTIKDIEDGIRQATQNGASRAKVEQLTRAGIADIGSTSNYGSQSAADTLNTGAATLRSSLSGLYGQDAQAAITALDQKFKELSTDATDAGKNIRSVTSPGASQFDAQIASATRAVDLDRQQIALTEQHAAALRELAAEYEHTYGAQARDAIVDLEKQVAQLGVTEHDQIEAAARDERAALAERQRDYESFADKATTTLAGIFERDGLSIKSWGQLFKSTIADLETNLLKSGLSTLFGGQGAGDNSLGDSLQRTLFGGVAPAGFPGLGGSAASAASQQAVLTRLSQSSKGTVDDPTHVVIAGGVGNAASGGSLISSGSFLDSAIAGAQQFGLVGALAGTAGANAIIGALPATTTSNGASASPLLPGGVLGDLSGVFGGSGAPGGGYGAGTIGSASGGAGGASGLGGLLKSIDPGSGGTLGGILKQIDPSGNLGTQLGSIFQGFGYGEAANSLFGGNQANGAIGSTIGSAAGFAFGGPLGSSIGGAAGGIIGGLFGNHTNAATSPDIYDTNNYNAIIAALTGKSGANGTTAYEDSTTKNLFSGGTALSGVEKLLAGGQASFAASTGIQDPQAYAEYLAFFGSSSTGAGTLGHGKNIGQLSVAGASGAGAAESYTQVAQQLAAIEQGLQSTGAGALGAFNTYSIRRALPDYNLALQSGGTATQEALQSGSGIVTGNKTTPIANRPIYPEPIVRRGENSSVYVDAKGSTFVGADGVSGLTDLIQSALARKNSGQLPNPYGSAKRAVPV